MSTHRLRRHVEPLDVSPNFTRMTAVLAENLARNNGYTIARLREMGREEVETVKAIAGSAAAQYTTLIALCEDLLKEGRA